MSNNKIKTSIVDNVSYATSTRKITPEGYLHGVVELTRVGVFNYKLSDLTKNPRDSSKNVKVFRPPHVVFNSDTENSAKYKPVTINHPQGKVNSKNFQKYSVGLIGGNVSRDDQNETLCADITINNENVVNCIEKNVLKGVSVGYDTAYVKKSGVYNGDSYDYEYADPMLINHLALVSEKNSRCKVVIKDSNDVNSRGNNMAKKKNSNNVAVDENKKDTTSDSVTSSESSDIDPSTLEALMEAEEAQENGEESEVSEKAQESPEETNEDDFNERVKKRVELLQKAQFLTRDNGLNSMNDREILEFVCSKIKGMPSDFKKKDSHYLMARIDASVSAKVEEIKAKKNQKKKTTSTDSVSRNHLSRHDTSPRLYSAMDMLRKKGANQ